MEALSPGWETSIAAQLNLIPSNHIQNINAYTYKGYSALIRDTSCISDFSIAVTKHCGGHSSLRKSLLWLTIAEREGVHHGMPKGGGLVAGAVS